MGKTQLDMVFELTTECPSCGKTELTEEDKESIFFNNECKSCLKEEGN